MPDTVTTILLDQNVPVAVAPWLEDRVAGWRVVYVNDLGFAGRPDDFLFSWAQGHRAIVITFDDQGPMLVRLPVVRESRVFIISLYFLTVRGCPFPPGARNDNGRRNRGGTLGRTGGLARSRCAKKATRPRENAPSHFLAKASPLRMCVRRAWAFAPSTRILSATGRRE